MPTLSEYSNVYGTALHVLRDKGYQVWFEPSNNLYWAERDGWDFASESPCGLLGVAAIYEHRKPPVYKEYWWRQEELDPRHLPQQPTPYRPALVTRRPPAAK